MVESILTIEGVKSIKITDRSHIGTYTFNECSIQEDIFTFKFCEAMQIDIILDSQPNGSLVDQKALDKYSRIMKNTNRTPLFFAIAIISFCFVAICVAPSASIFWHILSFLSFPLTVVFSILTLVYGCIEIKKGNRIEKVIRAFCIIATLSLWLWVLSMAF